MTGLHVNGVRGVPAAVLLEGCRRCNVANCTVLDSDGVGLWLKDVSDSRVSGCLVRDDRPGRKDAVSLRLSGGAGNRVTDNLLGGREDIDPKAVLGGGQ